jgi:hypothetical protein
MFYTLEIQLLMVAITKVRFQDTGWQVKLPFDMQSSVHYQSTRAEHLITVAAKPATAHHNAL